MNPDRVLDCFQRCMREGGHTASRAQIEKNLAAKRIDPRFTSDIKPLLRPEIDWNLNNAMDAVLKNLVARLPGEPWKGEDS